MILHKIVLIIPPSPWLISDRDIPMYGVLYLSSYLKSKGIAVDICDLSSLPEESWFIPVGDIYGVTGVSPQFPYIKRIIELLKKREPSKPVIVGGVHATVNPQHIMLNTQADACVVGEGELVLEQIMAGINWGYINGLYIREDVFIPNTNLISDMDSLPFPDRRGIDFYSYLVPRTFGYMAKVQREASMITGRGCAFNCLSGDTLVNTIEGKIKIKELVGRKDVVVLTRDKITHNVVFAPVSHIAKTGENKKLVRVIFDTGDYLDCTPDHRFKVFVNGNQCTTTKEFDVEAKNLKPTMSVRAVRYEKSGNYLDVRWGRRDRKKLHRLIMEFFINRDLKKEEWVHHIDGNKNNNLFSNLKIVSSKEHSRIHGASERMKLNNPTKNMNDEWRENISKAGKGKQRTYEQKLKYRESKLGNKNPNYRDGSSCGRESRISLNHKVVSVENIDGFFDTYCLEVPNYDWFYVNDVLVHNCSFCSSKSMHTGKVRMHSANRVVEEMSHLKYSFGVEMINFLDDTFILDRRRVKDICEKLIEKNLNMKWFCLTRVDCVDLDILKLMKKAGCLSLAIGFETGSNRMLQLMNKKATVEQARTCIKIAHEAGLMINGQLIVGFPTETEEDVDLTVKFVKDNPEVDTFGLHVFQPFPGSDVWNNPNKYGIDIDKNTDFSDYHTIGKHGENVVYHKNPVIDARYKYLKDVLGNRSRERRLEQ